MAENSKAKSCKKDHKRRKQFAPTGTNKRRKYVLEPGLKGFLCSCNFKEKECIREAYNILNEYSDMLYGIPCNQGETEEETKYVEEDIDNLLKEIEALKSEEKTGKRFQVVDSGVKNLLFIRTNIISPVNLAAAILKDINENKKHKTRFLLRLIPIEVTCKAYLHDIKLAATSLIDKYFKTSARSFSIVYNRRYNNNVLKEEVISIIADLIMSTRPDHKVNLKNADISVIVEIVKNIALLGVVPNYIKYRRYNLSSNSTSTLDAGTVTVAAAKTKQEADTSTSSSAK